jgi:signal transduction histidine kinase
VQAGCGEVVRLLSGAIEYARSLSRDLCPPILQAGGVVMAIEWLAQSMKDQYGLAVDLHVHGERCLDVEEHLQVLLYQAVRKTLFNCAKHAQVSDASVEIGDRDGRLTVVVADAGVGFDAMALTAGQSGGTGLLSL